MTKYKDAYTEVYEILEQLDEEEYNKIPSNVITAIRENRNTEYEFEVDEELELKEQELLPETKAILFNIFRDYLSTPEQKEKIIKMQAEERLKNEQKKAKQYNYAFDIHSNQSYRLTIEPIYKIVLRQMSGILTTSFVILIILGFSFWFLIRTILRQKTLEEMKSDFTNNITHELKTPIAVAYAANDALLNFNLAEDKQQRDKYLGICQEQLQRLSGLVEQILSMSMERRKTFRLHPETLSLHDLFPTLIEQHKLKAGKPVEINLDIAPEDLTIIADRTHFSNILSNLIDNAIKYSPDKADIMICCRKKETEQVEISVTDHGIGIPTDKQPHIFDKFYRVPTGNIHNTKGYGLGLFYVKTMVEKHGGMVTVRSEAGKGSTFTIRI